MDSKPLQARILILDHHDSYTNNLLHLLTRHPLNYTDAELERRILVRHHDTLTWDQLSHDILPEIDIVILSPGPGRPDRLEDFGLAHRLLRECDKPIFGICLGHQGMATAFGGLIDSEPDLVHGQVCQIQIESSQGLFKDLPPVFDAVRYNSLTVSEPDLPHELQITAYSTSPDGRPSIMGLQHTSKPIWGVQFHPESVASTYGANILSNFLDMATRHLDLQEDRALSHKLQVSSATHCRDTVKPLLANVKTASMAAHQFQAANPKEPAQVFQTMCQGIAPGLGEIWLDSARPTAHSRWSYLGIPSAALSYRLQERVCTLKSISGQIEETLLSNDQSFWSYASDLHRHLADVTDVSSECDIPVGWYGYLGYELKRESLPAEYHADPARQADAQLLFCPRVLAYDHELRTWHARVLTGRAELHGIQFAVDEAAAAEWLKTVEHFLNSGDTTQAIQAAALPAATSCVPVIQGSQYRRKIDQTRSYIQAGESYELNLTNKFDLVPHQATKIDPFATYLQLRANNPAPFAAYLALPGLRVLCSSPERLLQIWPTRDNFEERRIQMKPIKGTAQRNKLDALKDAQIAKTLQRDPKERAEGLMIVDLIRAEMASFCHPSSIEVDKLWAIESFETVHQLVSTISGTLKAQVGPFEAIKRCFPPGSMTGAPKLRTMQLLEDLEDYKPRGIYSGALGFISIDDRVDLSVVIRTLTIATPEHDNVESRAFDSDQLHMSIGAGGAITWLSDREAEWQEACLKAASVAKSLGVATPS
ncbi:uncharacterized protein L969DRAFT_93293 [Mixia osmundae IAM 14324]|uniref:aminodeoxychorismate synthase n=1 Tax=Mixia osmundae (strain CBS 9802 / IAM 14324 / JCM 22182 / KY 12970) TaxID=764103 RepID=G7E5I0_MIXOS|nr:uncharacterized protein L969DRAFT_93293 [Mixia osmundae IAM 14324]KEI40761.1 hypothetical protein L969DRAFT_93293 [Mixia osmundae IAM 14324]GAA98090.1 hypothetical protein E5Q_04772 [Mixia osmundae IAM 14324]